jgi:hypothetical protein
MAQQTTPESTGPVRPGKRLGQKNEFTVIVPLKPGGAERLREQVFTHIDTSAALRLGTLHEARVVIFENDTRLLLATTFDGSWDNYIEDFGGDFSSNLDAVFQDAEGYPGVHSPDVKDWFVKYQVEAGVFYSAYPGATVKQIKKGQRVLKAWEELLDTAVE